MDYRTLLQDELAKRAQKNRGYSVRAYARDLDVSPSYLSRVIRGHARLTEDRAYKIAATLKWDRKKTDLLVLLVRYEQVTDPKARLKMESELAKLVGNDQGVNVVQADVFRTISDWYHGSILEMVEFDDFSDDPSWIASRLGITPVEASLGIERLLRLGFLKRSGSKIVKSNPVTSVPDFPSEWIRRFHLVMLKKSEQALEQQAFSDRDFSNVTIAVDPSRYDLAKQKIMEFRKEMMRLLDGGNKSDLYQLSIQFFRVTAAQTD